MSNHTNDPWEAEMSRTFDQRVRDLHEAPLSFDQVRGRATRIRRTRRLAAAGGALAAAAVIVPVAVVAGGALTDDSAPGPAKPNPTAVDPAGAGYGYIDGRAVHLPDGSTLRFADRYQGGAVLGGTVFLVRNDDETGRRYLDVTSDEIFPVETTEILADPVVNDAGTMVAYIETSGDLVTRTEDGDATTLATGLGPNSQLTAVTGGPDCSTDECRAYVDDDSLGEARVYSSTGGTTVSVPDAIGVQDASDAGLLTVQTSYTDEGSCGGVYDTTTSAFAWETCDYFLFGLSPGSTYVDATHAYLDGFGNAYAAVLDARTGDEVARLDPAEGVVLDTRWEDDQHLLAVVQEPAGWTIYRLSAADGTVEQLLEPRQLPDDDYELGYSLLDGR